MKDKKHLFYMLILIVTAGSISLFGKPVPVPPKSCPACNPNPDVAPGAIMVGNLAGGEPRFLQEYFGDGPVILTFWATYCEPCAREMPELQRVVARYPKMRLLFISIDKSSEREQVGLLVNKWGITAPVLLDTYQATAKAYIKTMSVPATFIVLKGNIHFESIGYSEKTLGNLESALRRL